MRLHKSKSATALAVVLGFAASVNVQSQDTQTQPPVIVANQETKLDITPAGTPIINIAKPRDDGTSYNVFSKLNVGREGMIFNNSPKLGGTTLGGQILANPNLIKSGQSAKLILNEVIGGNRSDLNGPIEIFGPKASIIIANQSGITCDGCGFFNVERATLSTGRAIFGPNGAFSALAVDGGAVEIAGKGLLAGNVEFFDIIAASTSLNASLYARDLLIAGGNGEFDYARRSTNARDGNGPRVAIDSSLLGGMYANRIRLVGNGSGVGINLRGVVAALEGSLEITAQGDIAVANAVSATNVAFTSLSGNITINEQLFVGGNANLIAQGNIVQAGNFIAAAGDLNLTSGANVTLGGRGLFAGLGGATQSNGGALNITAAGDVGAAALQLIATKAVNATARNMDWGVNSSVSASGIDLTAGANLGLHGQLQSAGNLKVRAGEVALSGAAIANGALSIDASRLAITGDAVGVGNTSILLGTDLILGANSSLQSGGTLTLDAASIANQGRITGVGATNILVNGSFDNAGTMLSGNVLSIGIGGDANLAGVLNANGNMSITIAGRGDVAGTIGSGAGLGIAANALSVSGTISSGGNLDLKTSGGIDAATTSVLATDGALTVNAASVSLGGYTSAKGALDVAGTGAVKIGGQLHAGGDLALKGGGLTLDGIAVTNAAANFSIGGAASLDGILSANGAIQIQAAELTTGTKSQTVASGDVIATLTGSLTQRGTISGKAVKLTAGTLFGNDGTIFANGDLTLSASQGIANNGALEANGVTTLASGVINSNGRLVGIAGVSVNGGTVDLGVASNVQSGGALFIDATGSLFAAGTILSVGRAEFRSAAEFNQNATISLGNAGVFVAGGRLLQNGVVQAGGILKLAAQDVDIAGSITAIGGITGIVGNQLSVSSGGQLRSGLGLTLDVGDLGNAGLISANDAMDVIARGGFINSGQLVSEKAISIQLGRDFSQAGLIQAGGNLSAVVAGDIIANGTISSGGTLNFKSNTLNVGGIIAADGALALSTIAAQKIAENAVVFGKADASLTAGSAIDLSGQITANGAVKISATGNNLILSGLAESGTSVDLVANAISLSGHVKSLGIVNGSAANVLDLGGTISSVGAISLSAGALDLLSGSNVISDSDVRLTAAGEASLAGIMSSGQALFVNAADIAHSGQSLAGKSATFLASNGLVQSGTLQSGGTILLDAGNLALAGTTLGIDNVDLKAVLVNISGALSSNTAIQINSDSLAASGTISSLEGITATTKNDMVLGAGGVLETNGLLSLVARNIDLSGRLAAGAAGAKLSASRNFSSGGELLSGGDLQIDAGGAALVAGIIGANGLTSINAVDTVNLGGEQGSLGAISISGREISVTGKISGGSTIGLSSTAGISALGGSSILASDTISVESDSNIDASGTIASAADVSILAKGDLLLGGTISANDNVFARGATLITGADSITVANKKLSLAASTALENAGVISAAGIDISSDLAFTNSGDLAANGDLLLTAQNIVLTGSSEIQVGGASGIFARDSLETDGAILAIGAATLSGTNRFIQNAFVRLGTGGGQFVSSGSLTQNGTIEANGDIGLSGHIITGTGALLSDGAISFTAGNGGIDYAGNVLAKIGLNFTAPTQVRLAGTVITDGIATIDTGTLTIDGALSAFGGLNFVDVDSLNIGIGASLLSGADLSLHFIDFDNSGILASNKALAIDVAGQGVNSGSLLAGSGLQIKVGGDFSNSGTLSSVEGLIIDAGNDLLLAGLVQSEGAISLSAGNIEIGGTLVSLGTLGLTAVGNIGVTGSVSANLDASFAATELRIGATGSVIGGEDVVVNAAGLFENRGVFGAGGLTSAISIAAGNVLTHAGSLLQGSNSVTIRSLADIQLDGTLHANSALMLDAGAMLSLGGTAIGLDGITIYTTGGVSIGALGRLVSDGLTDITADNLQVSGLVQTRGDIDISVAGLADLGGQLLTGNDLFVDAANVTASGIIEVGRNAKISSGGDLIFTAAADVLSGGFLEFSSVGNFGNAGLIGSLDLFTITAGGGFSNSGSLLSKKDMALSGRSVTLSGILNSNEHVSVTAIDALLVDGDISAQYESTFSGGSIETGVTGRLAVAGNLSLTAADFIRNNGTLLSDENVTLVAGGDMIQSGIVSAGDILSFNVTGDAILSGQSFAGLSATVAARDITATGQFFADGDVTMRARNATLGGVIAIRGVVDVASENALISGDVTGLAGIKIAASGALELSALSSLASAGIVELVGGTTSAAGKIIGDGGVIIRAVASYHGAGEILSQAGNISITSDNTLIQNGALAAIGNITLSGLTSNVSGTIDSNGAVNISASGLTLGGQVAALGSITVNAADVLANQQSLVFSQNAVSISTTGDALLNGTVGAKTDFAVHADGDIHLGGTAQTILGNVNLSGQNAALSGSLFSGGQSDILASQLFSLSGTLSSIGAVDVQANDIDIAATGLLASDNSIRLRATDVLSNAGIIGTKTALDLGATNRLTNIGTLSAGTKIDMSSALVEAGGIIDAGTDLVIFGGAITTGGTIFARDNLSLTSTTGDIVLGGILGTELGAVNLASAGDLFVNGQTSAKTVLMADARDIIVSGTIFGEGAADVNATRNLAISSTGILASDGRVDIGFGGAIDLQGIISAGADLSLVTSQDLTLGGQLFSGGLLTLGGRDLTLGGLVFGEAGVNVTGRVITVGSTGAVQSAGILRISADTNLTVNGTLASENSIIANAQSMHLAGSLLSDGLLQLTATGALVSTALLSANNGDISLNAGTANLGGQIYAGKNVVLRASSAELAADLIGFDGVDLQATGALTMSGAASAIGSRGLVRLAGDVITTAGQINSEAAVTISAGSAFHGLGGIGAKGAVTVNSNGVLNSGNLFSESAINLSAVTTQISGFVEAGTAANISGTSGLDIGGILVGGTVGLTGGSITTQATSTVFSTGALSLTSLTGDILVNGTISSAQNTVSLVSERDINLNATIFGKTGAAMTAKRTNNIGANGGIISDGTLTLGGQNLVSAGVISAGAGINGTFTGFVTNNGLLLSDGGMTFATGAFTNTNAIQAEEQIKWTATGPVNVNGDIFATNAVDIKSTGSTLTISSAGRISSAVADVKLASAQVMRNDGIVFGKTGANLSATGTTLINTGQLVAGGGALSLTANQLDLGGSVFSDNALNLNGSTINVTGIVGAESLLSVSGNNVTVAGGGLLQSNNIAALNAVSLTVAGTLRTLAGNLNVTGGNVTVNTSGVIESGANLNVTPTATLTNNGVIAALGALSLSGDTVNLGGVTSSIGATTLGGGALTVTGLVESRGLLSVNATSTLSNSGTIFSNDNVTLQAVGVATLGGTIIAGKLLAASGGTINQTGVLSSGDNLTLTSAHGGITIGGTVVGQKAVNLIANGQNIAFNASAELFGKDSLSASATNINNLGKILSPGTITLNATNVLTQGNQLIAGGLASLTGGNSIQLTGRIDAGSVALNAPVINVPGIIIANGAVDITANTNVTVAGSILAGGNFTLTGAGTDFTIGTAGQVVSGGVGNISLTGIKNLGVAGLLSAGGNLSATYSGIANISGRVEAGNDIVLTSTAPSGVIGGATLIVPRAIVAGRDVTINGGATVISGTVYGDRNVSVSTSSYFADPSNFAHSLDVTDSGQLASGGNLGGNLNVNIIGDLNVSGPNASILSGGNATLAALTHNISGRVVTNGAVQFTNRGDLAFGPVTVALDGFNLTGSGSVQSSGALSITAGFEREVNMAAGTSLISNDNVTIMGHVIDSLGTVAAADTINLTSGAEMLLGGITQAGRRISAHAGDNLAVIEGGRVETIGNASAIAIARDQGANANISLTANGTFLSNEGTIFSGGSIFLSSGNYVFNDGGTVTGLLGVVAQVGVGWVINEGIITGASLGIFQDHTFRNEGTYVAANNLLIDAPEIINFGSGLIGAGQNLILQSGSSITNTGTLFAGNNLTLTAGTLVHNDEGTILALGDIAITADELINDSARIESLGGDVTINSGNVVNRIKDLVIVGGGGAFEEGFYRTDFTATVIIGTGPQEFNPQDCGVFIICESLGGPTAGFIVQSSFVSEITGIPYTAGFYNFFPGTPATGAITTNTGPSQIVAAGNVTINGGTGGVVTNRNSSILAGQNISITTGTLNNESTTVQTATGPVLLPAIIRAGGTVSIVANQINNGTVQNNGVFVGGPNDSFNTSNGPDAIGLGGMGSASGPGAQGAGLTGGTELAKGPGSQPGAASTNFAVDHALGGAGIDNNTNAGTGGGAINGGAGSGPAGGGNVAAVADGSVGSGVGGLPNGTGGVNPGAGSSAGNQGAVPAAGFNNNAVVLQPVNSNVAGAGGVVPVNADGVAINGPGGVGGAGSSGVQANVGPTQGVVNVGAGGGAGGGIGGGAAVGPAPSSVAGSTTTAQTVDGFDGQVVGITSVGTTSATTAADGRLNGAATPDGQQQSDLANVGAVGGPQSAATSTNGQASETAALLDGFNGIAIPGIIGANGDAGGFVFDFLRQFDLIGGANGSLNFANGDGLFTFNDSPDADFLFSTNRGFDEIGGLFDSDYFFDQLDVDRGTHFTRLGDGFFESQLIDQQVRAATQQAQLPQFGTSLAQAEGLMASAVSQQKALQLSVGVALSASQVSALTQSLVWWVSANVNGREVLVPVVYLAKNDQKSIAGGALIAGTNVVANVAGNITNSGTFSGTNIVSLTAGNDFINMAGGLVTGGTVGLTAGNDILNQAGAAITGGDIFLTAGRDIMMSSTIDTTSTASRESLGGKRFTSETITTQVATGSTIAATGTLLMNAGRDISISMGNVSAGGDAAMIAGRDVLITGVTTTDTQEAAWKTGKYKHGTSSSSEETFHGSVINVGGDLGMVAGGNIGIIGSTIKVGDDPSTGSGGSLSMQAGGGITIAAAQTHSSESIDERLSKKIRTNQMDATATTHVLSDISAGGNIGISTPGALTVAGATIAADGLLAITAGSVRVTGVMDEVTQDTKRVVKSGGMLSSKKTTTVTGLVDQSVVASTLEGDRVSINSLGDVSIMGSNVVATGNPSTGSGEALAITAGGMIDIGTMVEEDSSFSSVKVKKSGLSFSGGGLFVGVAKNRNDTTLESSNNVGSLIGSATGNVTLNAEGALKITGSDVVAPNSALGTVNLIGDSVAIAHAIDTATSTSLSKSSSFGVSVKAYENVSGAVNSVTGIVGRIGEGGQGAAGTAITGVSETLRTVAAVQAAMTNTAGVTASVGFSKSKTTSATQETAAVGSTIAGGTVNVTARDTDITVTGSNVAASGDINLSAARDVILQSAQNTLATQSKSSSSGASIGVSVGVAVVGGVTASASVGVNASKSSSSSSETTQVNTTVTAGETLNILTGRDATLMGAVATSKDVVASIGRDLNIVSVQDVATSKSSSAGFSAGLTLAPGVGIGANGSVNVGKGSSSSAIVAEQSALIAQGGSLTATVVGNTDLKGGVIAALDASGKDSGKLTLSTGTLTASDIKDSAKSTDISVGISASINNVTDKNTRSANLPVLDGSFASSTFKQDTKATIGQGVISVAVPDANVTLNRDIDQAQVVTKDSQTGFTVYIDPAAIKEVVAIAKGDTQNSVILQGVEEIKKDPLKVVKEAIKEATSLGDGVSQSGSLETLIAQLPNLLGLKKVQTKEEAQAQYDKYVEERTDAGVAAFEEKTGRLATEEEKAIIRSIAKDVAGGIVGINAKGMSDIGQLAEKIGPDYVADGVIGPNGELVVDGDWYSMSPGDQILSSAAKAGKWINSVDPKDREAIENTVDALFGGPVKFVIGKTIEFGLEKAAKENPELVGELARLANEAGIWATDKISRDDEQTVRDNNAADKGDVAAGRMPGTYIDNIFAAADLILGIDIPGVGKGKLPKGDLPDLPAKRNSGETVLGSFPDYVELSDELNARRFQIPDSVWNAMTPEQQWAANVRFLDRTILKGDTIKLSNPANSARVGTSFYKEIEYLKQKGYAIADDQMSLIPPVKK